MKDKVYQGQNFIDKVLETTGSTENAFEMALLNGMSLTDSVAIGQELQPTRVTRKGMVKLFDSRNRPASAIEKKPGIEPENEGIGFMEIGTTFIIQ